MATDEAYRRRTDLRVMPSSVTGVMEDYIHHFALQLHHDGTTITAVDVAPVRVPWSTCPVGAAGLQRLEGVPLADVGALEPWMGGRSAQCVHTTDLAVLAAAAALRGADRSYEIWMTEIGAPVRHATLHRDGELWAEWGIAGETVVADERFADLTLDRPGFSAWLGRQGDPDDVEAAVVLRRAVSIGMGRGLPMDTWASAEVGRPADESCHTYRAEVVQIARRNVGSSRRNEDDGFGTPASAPDFGGVRTIDPAT